MKSLVYILAFPLFIIACASPQKSFNKGNYSKSFSSAFKELEKNKNTRKNKTILNQSFKELMYEHNQSRSKLLRSDLIEDWEEAYSNSIKIIDRYEKAKRYLNSKYDSISDQIIYDNDLLEEGIAENYWYLALDEMTAFNENHNKFSAQDAHHYFSKSQQYNVQYETLDSLLHVSLNAGTIHILFETNAWDAKYNWKIDNKFRNIISKSRGFIKVHYENLASFADCRVNIDFNNLEVSESENTFSDSYSKEIQSGYETKIDSSDNTQSIPKYIEVTGEVVTSKVTRRYNWRINSIVRSQSPFCKLNNRSFNSEKSFSYESYQYTGDSRAIPDKYKNYVKDDTRQKEDRIIENLINDVYRKVSNAYF